MNKKIGFFTFAFLLTFVLSGCGGIQITIKDESKPSTETASSENTQKTQIAENVNEEVVKENTNTGQNTTGTDIAKNAQESTVVVSEPAQAKAALKDPVVEQPKVEASYSVAESSAEQAIEYLSPTSSQINVRVAPSIESRSVGVLYANQEAVYLHRKNFDPTDGRIWYHTQLQDGTIGWVSSKVVKQSDGRYYSGYTDYASTFSYLTVSVKQANLRSYPSIDASPIAVVYLNDSLEHSGKSVYDPYDGRTWYEVWTAGGTYGWISGKVIY